MHFWRLLAMHLPGLSACILRSPWQVRFGELGYEFLRDDELDVEEEDLHPQQIRNQLVVNQVEGLCWHK